MKAQNGWGGPAEAISVQHIPNYEATQHKNSFNVIIPKTARLAETVYVYLA
jgi:hypothetical protein